LKVEPSSKYIGGEAAGGGREGGEGAGERGWEAADDGGRETGGGFR